MLRRRFWCGWLALAAAAPAVAQDVTAKQVNDAIERGVAYLKRQANDGSWGDFGGGNRGGTSALATLALLSCELPPDDPVIAAALRRLRDVPPNDTYVVGLQTMCFQLGNPKKDYNLIKRNAEWLVRSRHGSGGWGYGEGRPGFWDNSNTQYALLGLQAASDAGVAIADRFWNTSREHWVGHESRVGSWGYRGEGASHTMTVAGIASLVITSQHLPTVKAGVIDGERVPCFGPRDDEPLRRAIDYMGRNFQMPVGRGGMLRGGWPLYYLYGLERAGRLTGRRTFGKYDWYRKGAKSLVDSQAADGSWTESGGTTIGTSFALLFLSKGRIPILVNKLQHGPNQDWNSAPNGDRHLTKFMTEVWQKSLNWQIVESGISTTEDMLQAPILHLSGNQSPKMTAAEVKVLREFVEQGGTIVADANCGVKAFDAGFRDLIKRVFPEPEMDLRPLEDGHAVWTSLFELQPNWPLEGVNVGCRTAVFYSKDDLSCHWEMYPKDQKAHLAAMRLGANIVAYATGPEQLQDKLDIRKVIRDATDDPISRGFLRIAKLKHNGDWNLAPKAVRNLMTSLKEVAKIDVVQQQRDLPILDPNLTNYPLVYMHGRTRFLLSDEEVKTLAEYLQTNGMLFADACCASEPFDKAFRETCKRMFPDKPLVPIPADHEIFTTKIGYDIRKLRTNFPAGGAESAPALEGIVIDGRLAVVYSKLDVGCALEKQSTKDCKGYEHMSALRLAANVVLYALKE